MRAYTTQAVVSSLGIATQIRVQIDHLLASNNLEPAELFRLPNSAIPTGELYQLCLCYEAMYTLLEQHELIKDGNVKQTGTIH